MSTRLRIPERTHRPALCTVLRIRIRMRTESIHRAGSHGLYCCSACVHPPPPFLPLIHHSSHLVSLHHIFRSISNHLRLLRPLYSVECRLHSRIHILVELIIHSLNIISNAKCTNAPYSHAPTAPKINAPTPTQTRTARIDEYIIFFTRISRLLFFIITLKNCGAVVI